MIDKIRKILIDHKGKKNRITAGKIAIKIGITENETYARTRTLIFECAKIHKLPLAADTKGYYLITNKKEYDDYIKNLDSRIAGIKERKRIITKNYENWEDNDQ